MFLLSFPFQNGCLDYSPKFMFLKSLFIFRTIITHFFEIFIYMKVRGSLCKSNDFFFWKLKKERNEYNINGLMRWFWTIALYREDVKAKPFSLMQIFVVKIQLRLPRAKISSGLGTEKYENTEKLKKCLRIIQYYSAFKHLRAFAKFKDDILIFVSRWISDKWTG